MISLHTMGATRIHPSVNHVLSTPSASTHTYKQFRVPATLSTFHLLWMESTNAKARAPCFNPRLQQTRRTAKLTRRQHYMGLMSLRMVGKAT